MNLLIGVLFRETVKKGRQMCRDIFLVLSYLTLDRLRTQYTVSVKKIYPPPWDRAYSNRVPRTNCALRIKKCAPRISSGIYFYAQVN